MTQNRFGVKARINPQYNGPCVAPGYGGAMTWIGIQPGGSVPTSNYDANYAVIQLGTINCNHPFVDAPTCDSTYRAWWAWGGCQGGVPEPRFLTNINGDPHDFFLFRQIDIFGKVTWRFQVRQTDGTLLVNAGLAENHPEVSCWLPNSNRQLAYVAERWDRGDSIGDEFHSGGKTSFDNLGFQNATGGTWFISNHSSCNRAQYSSCQFVDGDSMRVWNN
jgi:hypothetical protein